MEPIIFKPGQSDNNGQDTDNETNTTAPETTVSSSPTPEPVTPVVDEVPVKVDVSTTVPQEPVVRSEPSQPPTPPLPPKRSRRGVLAIALLLVLAIGGGGFAYWRANNLAKPAATAETAAKEVSHLRIGSNSVTLTAFYPDPNFVAAGSFSINAQIFEGLVGIRDATTIVPLLAESWSNPDDLTWEFNIRDNLTFQDGSSVTIDDVKRSFDEAKASEIPALITSTIESVTVVDEDTIRVKTTTPDPILLNKLIYVYVTSEKKDTHGVKLGTGAFLLDPTAAPTAEEVRLIAYDGYHSGKPAVRMATYYNYESSEALLEAVKNKQVEITDSFFDSIQSLPEVEGYERIEQATGELAYLGLNSETSGSPFARKEVRQALQLSLDTGALLNVVGREGTPLSQFTIPDNFGFDPELEPVKRDLAQAKELLANAGFRNGVTFTLSHTPIQKPLAEAIKAQAEEANFTVNLKEYGGDGTEYFNAIDNGDTQAFLLTVSSALVDSYDIFAFNFQSVNYSNPEFDALLEESSSVLNVEERKKVMQEASRFLMEDVASVPLFNYDAVFYSSKTTTYRGSDLSALGYGGYLRNISAQ